MLALSFSVEERNLLHLLYSNDRQTVIQELEVMEEGAADKELQATAQSAKRKVLELSDKEFKELEFDYVEEDK